MRYVFYPDGTYREVGAKEIVSADRQPLGTWLYSDSVSVTLRWCVCRNLNMRGVIHAREPDHFWEPNIEKLVPENIRVQLLLLT